MRYKIGGNLLPQLSYILYLISHIFPMCIAHGEFYLYGSPVWVYNTFYIGFANFLGKLQFGGESPLTISHGDGLSSFLP